MSLLSPAPTPAGPVAGLVPGFVRQPLQVGVRLMIVAVLAMALALIGPAGEANAAKKNGGKQTARSAKIVNASTVALRQVGDPYRYGSAGPNAFDCSGLMQFSFRQAGISIPRTSRAQAAGARKIAKKNLRRGDLMFFHNGGRVYHVAMFLGRKNGRVQMVHSPSSGKRVHRTTPWTSSWFAGTYR